MKICFLGARMKLPLGNIVQTNLVFNELVNKGFKVSFDDHCKADIVHANDLLLSTLYKAYKAKKSGAKAVITGHSVSTPNSDMWFGPSFFWDYYYNKAYGLFDKIIAVSDDNYNHFLKTGVPKSKLVVNKIGINLSQFKYSYSFREEFRGKHGLKNNDKVVLCVGHLSPTKGVYDFIKVREQLPNCRFLWVGDYPAPKGLRWLTRDYLKLKKIVKNNKDVFIGKLSYADMVKAYSGADLLLFLSNYETFGMVVLEALSTKLHVLVKPLRVFKELYGNNIFYGNSAKEFVKKIRNLKPKRFVKGRKLAQKYDYKKHVKRLVKIYDPLVNE